MTGPLLQVDNLRISLAGDGAAGDHANFFGFRAFSARTSEPKFCVNHIHEEGLRP